MAKAFSCRLAVVADVSVLSSSVQCGVVMFYHLAKENEWFEKCCKVNLTTQMCSALYRVTRLEPKSGRTQTAHFTLPTMLHNVLLVFTQASREKKQAIQTRQ